MMLSPGAIGAVSEVLSATDFYRESHAKIYRAASRSMHAASRSTRSRSSTSSTSVASSRMSAARFAIHELATLVPAAANAAHYARIVREMATLRGLIRAGNEITRLGHGPARRDPRARRPGRAGRSSTWLSRVSGDFTHIEELLKASFERITAALRGGRRRHRRRHRLPRARPPHVRASSPATSSSSPPARAWGSPASRSAWPRTSPCAARRRSRCSRSRCRSPRSRSG